MLAYIITGCVCPVDPRWALLMASSAPLGIRWASGGSPVGQIFEVARGVLKWYLFDKNMCNSRKYHKKSVVQTCFRSRKFWTKICLWELNHAHKIFFHSKNICENTENSVLFNCWLSGISAFLLKQLKKATKLPLIYVLKPVGE